MPKALIKNSYKCHKEQKNNRNYYNILKMFLIEKLSNNFPAKDHQNKHKWLINKTTKFHKMSFDNKRKEKIKLLILLQNLILRLATKYY